MWHTQWSTSYKSDEEVHRGAMGPETILDWVPLIGSIHITCLAQRQWAEPVTVSGGLLERAKKCMTRGTVGLGMRTKKRGAHRD